MVVVPDRASLRAEADAADPVEALIIDRQPLFLAALARLLEAPPLSAHVVTATRSDTGLEIARAGSVAVVLCELRAEPLSGVELVKALAEEGSSARVVLLGDEGDEPQLAAALAMRVAGAFTKNSSVDEFLAGIRAVVSGHRALGSGLLVRLLDKPIPEARRSANALSATELEILSMVGQAQSISAIAESRGISHKTVRNHLAKIYRKLEVHGRTEAVLWAARMGLTG